MVENLVLSCDHHARGDFRKGYYEIFYVSGEENQQSSHQSKDTYYFLKLSEQSRAKMAERKRQNFLICCQFRNHKVPIAQIKSSRSILHLRKCFFQQAEAISI